MHERTEIIQGGRLPMALACAMMAGYGLFRAANSSLYLSQLSLADSSFLFMTDVAFNAFSAFITVVCATCFAALAHTNRLPNFSMLIWIPTAILVAGAVLTQSGMLSALDPFYAAIVSAAAFAVGSTMLSLAWIELFAIERPFNDVIHIACGTLVGVIARHGITATPPIVAPALIAIAAITATCCLRFSRKRLPLSLEDEAVLPERPMQKRNRLAALDELSDTLLAFCVLEAVTGLVNSFMLAASMHFEGSAGVPNAAMSMAALLFCATALVTHRAPQARTSFRIVFPFIAAMVVFVPFMSEGYSRAFNTLLLFSYDFFAIMITYEVARISNKYRVQSYGLLGISSGAASASLLVALLLGTAFGHGDAQGVSSTMRFLVLGCAVIYLLSMVLVFFSRDRRKRGKKDGRGVAGVNAAEMGASDSSASEKVAPLAGIPLAESLPASAAFAKIPSASASLASAPHALASAQPVVDSFEFTCMRLADEFRLTERETEVLAYLARGRSNTYIAEELVLSPTTVRGHIRNIYAKLDVHKRQELIDLFQ